MYWALSEVLATSSDLPLGSQESSRQAGTEHAPAEVTKAENRSSESIKYITWSGCASGGQREAEDVTVSSEK